MIVPLNSIEYATQLIVCTEERIQKLWIYFELKRYLSLKHIDYFKLRLPDFRVAAFSK